MQISDQIIEVLDHLGNKIGVTLDWSQQNVMPQLKNIMGKYIKFRTIQDVMYLIISAAILVISIYFLSYSLKKIKYAEDHYKEASSFDFILILSAFAGIISIVVVLVKAKALIKLMTIPEMCVIEYLMTLINYKN